jgi:surfactin synthase thioesterase subunit
MTGGRLVPAGARHRRDVGLLLPFRGGLGDLLPALDRAGLGGGLAVLPVELPGRGLRRQEAPQRDLPMLIEALGPALRDRLDRRFILFGTRWGRSWLSRRRGISGAAMP